MSRQPLLLQPRLSLWCISLVRIILLVSVGNDILKEQARSFPRRIWENHPACRPLKQATQRAASLKSLNNRSISSGSCGESGRSSAPRDRHDVHGVAGYQQSKT